MACSVAELSSLGLTDIVHDTEREWRTGSTEEFVIQLLENNNVIAMSWKLGIICRLRTEIASTTPTERQSNAQARIQYYVRIAAFPFAA